MEPGKGVGAAVLAAGASTRMGRPKQELEVGGTPLVVRAVKAVCASGVESVCVVVGAACGRVVSALEGQPVRILHNRAWAQGMSTSVACAAHYAAHAGLRALCLVTADQPFLSAPHLTTLLERFESQEAHIVATRCNGRVMTPCVFARCLFEELMRLEGDQGACRLVRHPAEGIKVALVDVDGKAGELLSFDVDTPADLAWARSRCSYD